MDAIITIKKLIFVVALSVLPLNANSATYYVSPTGTATWGAACQSVVNGTSACSLDDAGSNAVAGDIVYLRGGTYTLDFVDASGAKYFVTAFVPSNSGTSGSPITFAAYDGETPVFNNSAN